MKEDFENVLLRPGRKRERNMFVRRATIAKERFARVPARIASELIALWEVDDRVSEAISKLC